MQPRHITHVKNTTPSHLQNNAKTTATATSTATAFVEWRHIGIFSVSCRTQIRLTLVLLVLVGQHVEATVPMAHGIPRVSSRKWDKKTAVAGAEAHGVNTKHRTSRTTRGFSSYGDRFHLHGTPHNNSQHHTSQTRTINDSRIAPMAWNHQLNDETIHALTTCANQHTLK